jgi:ABC-type dipeptide/oligopeptide/nickel transport system permease component
LVVSLPYLMTGLVIIERSLAWPGLSGALFDSLYNQDVPTALGALLVVGMASAMARLILDIVYAYLDPRIRYDTGSLGGAV